MVYDFSLLFTELMLLGFISLLLTVGQGTIAGICISEKIAATWHPCGKKQEIKYVSNEEDYGKRRLLEISDSDGSNRRVLAAAGDDKCGEVWSIIICLHNQKTEVRINKQGNQYFFLVK